MIDGRGWMGIVRWALGCGLALTGCGSPQDATPGAAAPTKQQVDLDSAAQRQASLAKLSDEDRALAEAQGFCAVSGEPLGSMGVPLKLILNDQAVFVCCKGCEGRAKAKPDQTLAKAAEFKAKTQTQTPSDPGE